MNNKKFKFNYSIQSIPGIRETNDDACAYVFNNKNQSLAVACDGIGSQPGSQQAARFITDFFKEAFTKTKKIHFINRWFDNTLKRAFFVLNHEFGKLPNSIGTTLLVAIISDAKAYIFNIGDTRLYHFTSEFHSWKKVTVDHNLYNFLEANHAPQSVFIKNKRSLLALTNYIDSKTDEHMSYSKYVVDINNGDILLLATDGFYNFLNIQRIDSLISFNRENGFSTLAASLVDEALKAGSNDNITCIIIEACREIDPNKGF